MHTLRPFVALLCTLAPLATAHAFVYTGNPELELKVDRPSHDYVSGSVRLQKVRVHACGGGYTDYPVNADLDPVRGFTLSIATGDHCSITAFWSTDLVVQGPAYTVKATEDQTFATLGSTGTGSVALTPYAVVQGAMTGSGPWLVVAIR